MKATGINYTRMGFLMPSLGLGGAERVVLNLARSFLDRGLEVDLLVKEASGSLLEQVPAKVNIIDLRAPRMFFCLPGVIRYLRQYQPVALVGVLETPNVLVILAKLLTGSQSIAVTTTHQTLSTLLTPLWFHRSIDRYILRMFYPKADHRIAVSQGAARDLGKFARISSSSIQVIYNPINLAEVSAKSLEPIDHPWLRKGEPPVILAAGRLSKEKNFEMLIRAFALVREKQPARLMILGEGVERSVLMDLVLRKGLGADVQLPGFVSNPFAYMRHAAVLALSSVREGFGNVLVEAMACGCPVVSTNCPSGPYEILSGGKYGHLVPVGDEAAMAKAILAVLSGDTRYPPLDWLMQFELETISNQYLELFYRQQCSPSVHKN